MIRLEVYLDSSNKLKVSIFKNSQYESKILEGRMAQELIKQLYSEKVMGINESDVDTVIRFEDFVLRINEFDKLVSNENLTNLFMPIFLNVKKFEEKEKLNNLKNRKVKRQNKHTSKKIIVTVLVALILTTAAMGKINAIDNNSYNESKKYVQVVDYPKNDETIVTDSGEEFIIEFSDNSYSTPGTANVENTQQNNNYEEEDVVSLSYTDRSSTDKAYITNQNYRDVVEKYSKMYGLDANLMLAIATQETGDHYSNLDDGPAVGLMQIEKSVWANGGTLSAYNFDTESWETIEVSEDSYEQFVDNLKDLDYNVKIACMMFQESLRNSNYNILVALQNYNMGYGNMHYTVLPAYCSDVDKDEEEVLNDQYDIGWMEYRDLVEDGDSDYVEHVLSYCGEDFKLEVTKPSGEKVSININNDTLKKVY